MKNSSLLAFFFFASIVACTNEGGKKGQSEQEVKPNQQETVTFLTEATIARLMSIEQGNRAREQGTTESIRRYGARMMSDQKKLLNELRMMASAKKIQLPETLNDDQRDALAVLIEKEGKEFDKQFIRMARADHSRDIQTFREAAKHEDQDIKQFASNYLPVIEFHLSRIEEIRENYDSNLSESRADEEQD